MRRRPRVLREARLKPNVAWASGYYSDGDDGDDGSGGNDDAGGSANVDDKAAREAFDDGYPGYEVRARSRSVVVVRCCLRLKWSDIDSIRAKKELTPLAGCWANHTLQQQTLRVRSRALRGVCVICVTCVTCVTCVSHAS